MSDQEMRAKETKAATDAEASAAYLRYSGYPEFAALIEFQAKLIAELEQKQSWQCACGEWNHHFDENCGDCCAERS